MAKVGGQANVQKTTNNGQQGVDSNTYNQLGAIQSAYGAAGAAGPGSLLTGAGQYGTAAQTAGNTGLLGLSGDPNAMAQLMNPYQQQVIDANNAQWGKVNQQTQNQVNDRAQAAGAFGGSRQGVAVGTALSNNNQAQAAQTAGLLNSGYQNAQGVAGQLAGLGFQGAGLNANLGMSGVGNPALWYAQMLKNGFIMPTGSTQSGAQTSAGAQAATSFGV